MLPDPRLAVKDKWRDKGVLWYPARFIKHRPHTQVPGNQFEFRYMECIHWPLTEDDLMRPSRHCAVSQAFCEEILKVELRPDQIGTIRYPAFYGSNPAEDHPLIKIFDAAVDPLAKLLVSFPDAHPVVSSYKRFFTNGAADYEDSRVEAWIAELQLEPFKELTVLMAKPLEQLQDFRLVSVPGRERRRRVLTVGHVMLQILALQYELKEPLDLNGDMFEDLVEGAIKWVPLETSQALRAMLLATKLKELSHKNYWDIEAFGKSASDFEFTHSGVDSTYRPDTYRRNSAQEIRRPPIAVDVSTRTEEDEVPGKLPTKTRPRVDGGVDDEDAPAPKRQAMSRLRPRGTKGPRKEQVAAVPVGKVVASGKGWFTIDVDDVDDGDN
ncbi:hypothetical protein C8R44DRAFT_871833 [Mycena epipterygia]|nr:hypothetical protein C8R44DRAFT_871833 [Mycena epipterygia]